MLRYLPFIALGICLLLPPVNAASTQDEIEKWFKSDELELPSKSSSSELIFIPPPEGKPVLQSINKIIIYPQSIKTGWVELAQCYRYLDAVPDMEVSYQYKAMRKLKIVQAQNIGHAFIKNNSIQLADVNKDAQLCASAEVRILYKNSDSTYRLVNGPFHRRFLDSFFPYHLTMQIHYPASLLELVSNKPEQQPGFTININTGMLSFDTYFTGKLYTEFVFKHLKNEKR